MQEPQYINWNQYIVGHLVYSNYILQNARKRGFSRDLLELDFYTVIESIDKDICTLKIILRSNVMFEVFTRRLSVVGDKSVMHEHNGVLLN